MGSNSTVDLIKEPPTPNDTDDEDDAPIGISWSCSRQSSTNSDYSLARTISNMSTTSTVSTIPITPIGEDNPVFYDELISENPSRLDVSQH